MNNIKKWASIQSIIIITTIFLIFVYIGMDLIKINPEIKSDLKDVKLDVVKLSLFLDKKVPEIDSTLKLQAEQISEQSLDIENLNKKVKNLAGKE